MKFRSLFLVVCAAVLCVQSALAQKPKADKKASTQSNTARNTHVAVPAPEPQIDFVDLMSNDAGGDRRTIYAEGAANEINGEVEGHGQRHNAALVQKRASSSSGSSGSSSDSSSSSSPSSSRSSSSSKPSGSSSSASSGSGKIEYVSDFWTLKNEMKSITIRCPNGAERSYSFHVKTGRYCTPSMTCNTSEAWIHRALC